MTEPLAYGEGGAALASEERGTAVRLPLYRNRMFAAVYVGNTLSVVGDGFLTIAIGYWVLAQTGSAQAMTAVMLPQMLAGLALGTMAGTFADRRNRRAIMLAMDLVRAALMLGVGAVVATDSADAGLWLLVPMLALASIASQFHSPAFQSSLSYIVGQERIGQATGLMQVTDTLARLGGLTAGGAAVAAFGASWAVVTVGLLYLSSALAVAASGKFPIAAAPDSTPKSFWTDLREGIAFIRGHALTRSITVLLPSVMIVFVASMMLFQVIAVTKWQATPAQFGMLEAAIPVGFACGSGLVLLLGSRITRRGWWICAAVLLSGPNLIILSGLTSVFAALPFAFGIGFLLAVANVLVIIALRTETEVAYHGRLFGTLGAITNTAAPIGLILSGLLSDSFGADRMLLANGLVLTAIAAVCAALLKQLRGYR